MDSAVRDFEAVYRKYEGLVRATLRRYGVRPADLDDVAQEAFVTIHRKLPEFEGRSSLETWLHAVCWRTAVGYRRRAHIQREALWTVESSDEEPERVLEGLPAERLHAVLEGLSEQQRELLALSEAGGLSISALAEAADCTRETASEQLKRARLALRRRLDLPPAGADAGSDADAPGVAVYSIEGAIESADSFDYIDDEGCICVLGTKTFALYRRGPSARFYGVLKEAMRKAMEREGPRLTYIAICERGSAAVLIDRAARKVHQEIIGMLSTSMLGAAIAVETSGFSLVPAVINAAVFLTRSKIPFRYFTNIERAAAWIAPRTEGDTAASLVAQCEWMRARMDERDAATHAQAAG